MQGIFSIIIGRFLGRFIGLNIRYLFFRLSGKKVSYEELKTPVLNKENNYEEKGLQQDMYNALVGALAIVLIILILKIIL